MMLNQAEKMTTFPMKKKRKKKKNSKSQKNLELKEKQNKINALSQDLKNYQRKELMNQEQMQNNFDGAKHSISTLNTSSSSYKEKDVLNEEKKSINLNDIKTNGINLNESNNDNNAIKNKFDEVLNQNQIQKHEEINPHLVNTVILQVSVKLPNNQTVMFKLKRFDDLFLTIKLFCEINSIEEKLIKPIIIKSLCAINTIYQIT